MILILKTLAIIGLYYAKKLYNKVKEYLDTSTTREQKMLIKIAAKQVFAFVEAAYRDLDGPQKLEKALAILDEKLKRCSIPVTAEEMREAIEEAWLEDKRKQETTRAIATSVTKMSSG